jgi:hypothetical protein
VEQANVRKFDRYRISMGLMEGADRPWVVDGRGKIEGIGRLAVGVGSQQDGQRWDWTETSTHALLGG